MDKLVGYQRKQGTFVADEKTGEVKEYDYYLLHFVTDENPDVVGYFADQVRANTDKFKLVGFDTLDAAIGQEVMFGFDLTAKVDENGKTRMICNKLIKL